MVIRDTTYTVSEFEAVAAQHPESLLELIDGRIVEKVTSEQHGNIVLRIGAAVLAWQTRTGAAGHATTEASHRLPDDEKNLRRPDFSFRYTDETISDATALDDAPDFAVEVKSRTNDYDELRDKARLYLQHGARLVWLVYPSRQIVEVYSRVVSDDDSDTLQIVSELYTPAHTLTGRAVLPDFELAVKTLFSV